MWDENFKGRYVLIEPTDYCNCNCIMCTRALLGVENPHNVPKGFMELETFKSIIDGLKFGNEPLAIKLFWIGESLMHPDFIKMLDYTATKIKHKNAYIDLHTNGLLMSHKLIDFMLTLGSALPRITFSLDAFSSQVHKRVRRGGELGAAIKNIKYLVSQREKQHLLFPRLILQFIIMDENAHETKQFFDYWSGFLKQNVKRSLADSWPLLSGERKLELLKEKGIYERFMGLEHEA